jgi:hypothetical protein
MEVSSLQESDEQKGQYDGILNAEWAEVGMEQVEFEKQDVAAENDENEKGFCRTVKKKRARGKQKTDHVFIKQMRDRAHESQIRKGHSNLIKLGSVLFFEN